jgi:hypothetical protein
MKNSMMRETGRTVRMVRMVKKAGALRTRQSVDEAESVNALHRHPPSVVPFDLDALLVGRSAHLYPYRAFRFTR